MSRAIIELENITKKFNTNGLEALEVLSKVDLIVNKGEMVGLLSPSGAGKSTLLQIVGLLDSPTSGKIFIEGRDTSKLSDSQRTNIRNTNIGFVYQFHHLLPEFSAVENVSIPQWCLGVSRKKALENAINLLDQVGLADRANHRPSELSGGEQQRVALCRALVNGPSILLADEPTGNLDTKTSELVFELLINLVKQKVLTAVIVTHNIQLAQRMDRVLGLKDRALEPIKF
jgi:lipoprotein-releasing system ATP-binding protein